jgi:hypothetical protein
MRLILMTKMPWRAPPDHENHIALAQLQLWADLDELAVALDLFDGDGCGGIRVFDLGHRSLEIGREFVDAAHQRRGCGVLVGPERCGAGLHGGLGRNGVVPDRSAHELRQDVDADDDRAERAEDVGDCIADGHVALKARHLVRGKPQLGNGVASGTDDGGLRQAARRNPRCEAFVEAVQLCHDDHRGEASDGHHDGEHDFLDRALAERAEELRSAFEADCVDEEREKHRLDAVVDLHANLADNHRDQQRAGHAAQLELAELQLADVVAQRHFACSTPTMPTISGPINGRTTFEMA